MRHLIDYKVYAYTRSIEAGLESFSAIFAGQSLRAPLAHCPLDPEASGIERQRGVLNIDLGVRKRTFRLSSTLSPWGGKATQQSQRVCAQRLLFSCHH